ncbi:MAG: ribonuclease III [Pseudomonadota bacterium]
MDFEGVESLLGHHFTDRSLLERALTHASFGSGASSADSTYQRLEFLGDRVLAVVIADALMARYPKADEGELARRLNHLVRAESCALIARGLGVDQHVRTDDLEMRSDTRAARAVLADVCEALIGALYLDAGLQVARTFIERHWSQMMDEAGGARRDPKTALQEWAHGKFKATPAYVETGRAGPDHAPVFEIAVHVDGVQPVSGSGKSKRDAQQAAALAMLIEHGVWEADRP